jgi:hypothetical protein
LRWLECDVVAEAWGLNDHEVGACESLLDKGDAIGTY